MSAVSSMGCRGQSGSKGELEDHYSITGEKWCWSGNSEESDPGHNMNRWTAKFAQELNAMPDVKRALWDDSMAFHVNN